MKCSSAAERNILCFQDRRFKCVCWVIILLNLLHHDSQIWRQWMYRLLLAYTLWWPQYLVKMLSKSRQRQCYMCLLELYLNHILEFLLDDKKNVSSFIKLFVGKLKEFYSPQCGRFRKYALWTCLPYKVKSQYVHH